MAEPGFPIESMSISEQPPQREKKVLPIESKTEASAIVPSELKKKDISPERIKAIRRKISAITKGEPVHLANEDQYLIGKTSEEVGLKLEEHFRPGFGVTPSSQEDEAYYGRVFTRDFAQAAGNHFAEANPQAAIESLSTILKYQRTDGMLPAGVEREYLPLKVLPGLNALAKPLFQLIEGRIRGRQERPVFAGKTWYGEEDAVPAAIIAAGELFLASQEGRSFVEEHFEQLKKAVEFTKNKVDPQDGLINCQENGPDWQNSINRGGKLGGVNVLWARSLRLMEFMAESSGREEDAKAFREDFRKAKEGILAKIYNKEGHYFAASTTDGRLDTVASIYGALYLLGPQDAAMLEQTLSERVMHKSGLGNFDPPYPGSQIKFYHRLEGIADYHNKDTWPWVFCENIQVKVKIGQGHPDSEIRDRYKQESVSDLLQMAKLFKEAGGAYEVFEPDSSKPEKSLIYKPPKNFMGSMAAFKGAEAQLKELGWI
jgi:glycogen debranching enzyme